MVRLVAHRSIDVSLCSSSRDTAGQERFRSLTASFFRDAIGFLLVFDLTSENSFLNVRHWIGQIQDNAYSEHVDMILVGNKCDLGRERIITKARAEEFANQNHVDYIETSALTNINVAESVELLLDAVMDRLVENQSLSGLHPHQQLRKRSTASLTQNKLTAENDKLNRNWSCCSKWYCGGTIWLSFIGEERKREEMSEWLSHFCE